MRFPHGREFNNLIKNILTILCSLIIAAILIEITLHIWDPFEFRVKGDKIVLPNNRHYIIKNNKISSLDDVIIHTKNSLGFRGDNPPEKFPDYLTIVTVGGSTTECFYLSDGKTWTDALGGELKQDFKKVWINNAGLDGCSSRAHIVLLNDYIVKLKPKIVIFLVGGNDIWLKDAEIFDNQIRLQNYGVIKNILQKSEIYSLGLNLYRYWEARNMKIVHSPVNLRTIEHISIPEEQISLLVKMHKDHYVKSYEQRLASLINICNDYTMRPVLITQPSLFGKGNDDITGVNLETPILDKKLSGKAYWTLLELYNETTRRVAAKNGAWLIDLAKEMPKSSKYFYDTVHFTNEGAQKVAEIIYPELSPLLAKEFKEFQIDRKN